MKTKSNIAAAIAKGITTKHSGKMEGMQSFSTACSVNPICQARAKDPDSVCAHCYAMSLLAMRKNLDEKERRNLELMSSRIYNIEDMPIINACVFRLEAFGDLANVTQAANYFTLARANRNTTFALWTKNPDIIAAMMEETGMKKPRNLIIIYSSPKVNTVCDPEYVFIDKVFTVYDKAHAADVKINCGARHCLTCGRCYSKRTGRYVNELLK